MDKKIKIDIISGFLGAGETTLINKLLEEVYLGEKVAILENEFGEIGIDNELLAQHGLVVKEIVNGCICCSLQGDFIEGMKELATNYSLDRIVVEPTGIGAIQDVLSACRLAIIHLNASINAVITVVDATMLPVFLEVGGDYYEQQIIDSLVITMSFVQNLTDENEDIAALKNSIRQLNPNACIFAEPWDVLNSLQLLTVAEEITKKEEHNKEPQSHHEHIYEDEKDNFESCAFYLENVWFEESIRIFIKQMNAGNFGRIYRSKGFFSNGEKCCKLDYVYGRATIIPVDYKGESKVVIVGKNLNCAAVQMFMMGDR